MYELQNNQNYHVSSCYSFNTWYKIINYVINTILFHKELLEEETSVSIVPIIFFQFFIGLLHKVSTLWIILNENIPGHQDPRETLEQVVKSTGLES